MLYTVEHLTFGVLERFQWLCDGVQVGYPSLVLKAGTNDLNEQLVRQLVNHGRFLLVVRYQPDFRLLLYVLLFCFCRHMLIVHL